MKILGESRHNFKDHYIVEISFDEICEVANLSYGAAQRDAIKKLLKVGEDYPISKGYNFKQEIISAVENMDRAYGSFSKAAKSMGEFAGLIRTDSEGKK